MSIYYEELHNKLKKFVERPANGIKRLDAKRVISMPGVEVFHRYMSKEESMLKNCLSVEERKDINLVLYCLLWIEMYQSHDINNMDSIIEITI